MVVTIKYAIFIMRADNKGEGGIIALMALALQGSKDNPKKMAFIVTIGLLGASLFFGDSIITPAISVLSAVEGLQIIAPPLAHYVLPITDHGAGRAVYYSSERLRQDGQTIFADHVYLVRIACDPGRN